ncbi:hypothetical protein GC197_02540 [bacterium]|nr:hypothetical protein [bacterium]
MIPSRLRWTNRNIAFLATVAVCLVIFGCGKTDQAPSITGTVTVDGKPADGLYVVFHDANGMPAEALSSTRTEAGGQFSWTLPQPGEYVVTAFWPKQIVAQEETIEGPDLLRGKYRQVDNPAATVTIEEGHNELSPIELSR